MRDEDLIALAAEARNRAYAPYSKYQVGAALLTASHAVYSGCNVENASYRLTVCAEHVAVVKAVSDGEREFVAIAVVTEDGGTPCGACRQILNEYAPNMRLLIADPSGKYETCTLRELLPKPFVLR